MSILFNLLVPLCQILEHRFLTSLERTQPALKLLKAVKSLLGFTHPQNTHVPFLWFHMSSLEACDASSKKKWKLLTGEWFAMDCQLLGEGNDTPLQYSCLENPMDGGAWKAAVHGVAEGRIPLSDFTFTFHFHALEKEMATHSSVLAWRIPGTGEPGGLPSRVAQSHQLLWNNSLWNSSSGPLYLLFCLKQFFPKPLYSSVLTCPHLVLSDVSLEHISGSLSWPLNLQYPSCIHNASLLFLPLCVYY